MPAPGAFLTEPNLRWSRLNPAVLDTFKAQIPMGEFGRPEDLGPLAVYLASDEARWVTGHTLVIDGKVYKLSLDLATEYGSSAGQQSTTSISGRLTVYNGVIYFAEDSGKIWAIDTRRPTGVPADAASAST